MLDGDVMQVDILVVGAGFGGLNMLHQLRQRGFDVVVVEAGQDVGGAWYWNRYPGARCDVESILYSYSALPEIEAEWQWTERYAGQAEIQSYLSFVADKLDLRKDIVFGQRIEKATFDEDSERWEVVSDGGSTWSAQFVVLASGPLTVSHLPDIPGIADFTGETFHTAQWPQDRQVDFAGKRVGVIGTGSSGTQLIPVVADQAERLFVFVRTPNYVVPANNFVMTEAHQAYWQDRAAELRALVKAGEISGGGDAFVVDALRGRQQVDPRDLSDDARTAMLQERWDIGGVAPIIFAFANLYGDEYVNEVVSKFLRSKVAEIVQDIDAVETLTPTGYPFCTKRPCAGDNFYETFNRPNVEAVNVRRQPIERVTRSGIRIEGRDIELDTIIFATGFDAMTGAVTRIDIRGRGGMTAKDAWASGPDNFLGMTIAGFPNLFMLAGPGSPSVLYNVVMANELQIDFITGAIDHMKKHGLSVVEPSVSAQQEWVDHCAYAASLTLLDKVDSWYVGANVPGKARVVLPYTGGLPAYRDKCAAVERNGYEGFMMANRANVSGLSG